MRRLRFIPRIERLEGKLLLAGDGPSLPPGGLEPEPPAMEAGGNVSVAFRTEHIGFSNYLVVDVGDEQGREVRIVGGAAALTDANGEARLWYPHGSLSMDVAMVGATGDMEPLATLKLDFSGRVIEIIAASGLSASASTDSPILLSVDPTTVLHDALHSMLPVGMPAMTQASDAESMDAMSVDMAMDSQPTDRSHADMPAMQMAAMSMEGGDMSAHGATATHAGDDAIANNDEASVEHSEAVAARPTPLPDAETAWDEDYYPEEIAAVDDAVSEVAESGSPIQLASAEFPVEEESPATSAVDLVHEIMTSAAFADDSTSTEAEPETPSRLTRAVYAVVAVSATAGAIACDRLANRSSRRQLHRRPAWLGGFLVGRT